MLVSASYTAVRTQPEPLITLTAPAFARDSSEMAMEGGGTYAPIG